ncbi:MAG: amidohydrolase family protein, partial [Spirochaetaceae bacterium]|nr:amidohydrolase family protein [Spirochaetaceae bacterium]
MNGKWDFTEMDKQQADELQVIIPSDVFDAHAHLYRREDLHISGKSFMNEGPEIVDIAVWKNEMQNFFPGSGIKGGLFLSTPAPDCDIRAMNSFLIGELSSHPDSRGLLQFSMDSDPDEYIDLVKSKGIAGFKPYHFSSAVTPTSDSLIPDFLPEWVWSLADKENLVITLHIVRDGALMDSDNRKEIISMCRKYPGVKLVLAHAGRGFNAFNTVKGIAAYRGLDNLWFDMSGICEAEPLLAILHEFGPLRLLWGSDFPISQIRGRAVTVGHGFAWLQESTVDWENPELGGNPEPLLLGLESLRAFKTASDEFGLNREDVANIFCGNALRLLDIERGSGTKTQDAYRYAKKRIPGGTQLLSKRPENMAPDRWPAYFTEASGCETRD